MNGLDPTKLKKTKEAGVPGILFCVARVPETQRLICGNSDFKVYEFDLSAEKVEPQAFQGPGHESYVTGIVLAGKQVISGSYDGRLVWWNLDDRTQVRTVDAHQKWIRRLAVSPDGKRVVSVADDMVCRVWDIATGDMVYEVTDHQPLTPHHYPSMLYAVTISEDGKWMATGDKTGHVAVWEFASGKKVAELEAPVLYTWDPRQRRHSIGGIRSLQFSHDSQYLAVGGIGKIGNIDHLGGPARLELFRWQKAEKLHELEDGKFKGLVEQIRFAPDDSWFITAGGDHGGYVTIYDRESGKILKQEKAPMHIHDVALNESRDTLYTVGHGKIAVWELKAEPPVATEKPQPDKPAESK